MSSDRLGRIDIFHSSKMGGGGGSNCLYLIESHIICDFPWGGGPDPLPPLPSGSALVANFCAGSNSLTVKIFNTFDWIKIMCTFFFFA